MLSSTAADPHLCWSSFLRVPQDLTLLLAQCSLGTTYSHNVVVCSKSSSLVLFISFPIIPLYDTPRKNLRNILHSQSCLAVKGSQLFAGASSFGSDDLLNPLRSRNEPGPEWFRSHVLTLGESVDASVKLDLVALFGPISVTSQNIKTLSIQRTNLHSHLDRASSQMPTGS